MTTRIALGVRSLLIMAATLACAVLTPRHGFGHGTPFSVGFDARTGKITVTPDVYLNFSSDELFVVDEFGFITNDGTPGWDKGATLPSGARLNLRFQGPLRYWNPATTAGDPLPVPGASLSILAPGGSAQVTAGSVAVPSGVTGTNPVFLAPFTSHHHVVWEILNPDGHGLYGLWARLESERPCTFPAAPSDPFLVVLNYGVTSEVDYIAGSARLVATAAPTAVTIDVASGSRTQGAMGHPVINLATSLTKTGAGSLIFDESNAFVGPTTVAAGSLVLANPQALFSSTRIEIAAQATLDVGLLADGLRVGFGQTLGGAGTIAGSVTFGCGSTLAPGAAGVAAEQGILTIAVPEPSTLSLAVAALTAAACRWRPRGRFRTSPARAGSRPRPRRRAPPSRRA